MSVKHQSDVLLDVDLAFSGPVSSVTATLYTATASASTFTASATGVGVTTSGSHAYCAVAVSALAATTRCYVSATGTVNGVSETQRSAVRVIDASVTSRLAPTTAGRSLDVTAAGKAPATLYAGDVVGDVSANVIQWSDTAVTGMPMQTYTQPVGFLATTFAGTVGTSTYAGADTAGTGQLLARLTATRAGKLDGVAQIGDAMTLTVGERTNVADEVERQIIDDTDTEKVLAAITAKIAAANPSLSGLTLAAIGSAVRTELAAELARIDVANSTRATQTSSDAIYDKVDTEVGAIKAKTDALPATPASQADVQQVPTAVWGAATKIVTLAPAQRVRLDATQPDYAPVKAADVPTPEEIAVAAKLAIEDTSGVLYQAAQDAAAAKVNAAAALEAIGQNVLPPIDIDQEIDDGSWEVR